MAKHMSEVNSPLPLKNVAGFMTMTQQLLDRGNHQSGLGVCHGPSGYGKTWSALFAQNRLKAAVIEALTVWRPKNLLQAVLKEYGVDFGPRTPVAELQQMAIEAMSDQPDRPLIIDEADKALAGNLLEIARELQERSTAPVILIGEEKFPLKLAKIEKLHNRVLSWFAAQPCDVEDARVLAEAFVKRVALSDDLLAAICSHSDGRARRIINNLAQVEIFARNKGLKSVDAGAWSGRPFDTGEPPLPRPVAPYKHMRAA